MIAIMMSTKALLLIHFHVMCKVEANLTNVSLVQFKPWLVFV